VVARTVFAQLAEVLGYHDLAPAQPAFLRAFLMKAIALSAGVHGRREFPGAQMRLPWKHDAEASGKRR
jgi:hypothetical protein